MKKLILFLLLCVTAWSNAVAQSQYDTKELDGIKYTIYTDLTAKVTKLVNTNVTNVVIPDKITFQNIDLPVVAISNMAFKDCINLQDVTIPNSVTAIGISAFSGCANLIKVYMSNNLKTIGSHAFEGCSKLHHINLPNCVTSIGDYAFKDCRAISYYFKLPSSVKSIGSYAFNNCPIKDLTIPSSVTSIGQKAFYGYNELLAVNFLPDSEITLGDDWISPNNGFFNIICKVESYQDLKIPDTWTVKRFHSIKINFAVDPTCTTAGHIEGWTCEYCHRNYREEKGQNEISESQWVIPAHHFCTLVNDAVAETCTTDGNNAYYVCDICEKFCSDATGKTEIEKDSWVIPAHHFCTLVNAVAETCTTDGNDAYYDCDKCDKFCSDAEGKNEIEENSWVIPAHHFCTLVAAVEETCTTDGNYAYYDCDKCDKFCSDAEGKNEIVENSWVKPAFDHDWEDIYDEPNYTWTHHCKNDAAHDIHRKQLCFEAKADNSKLGWGQTTYDRIYNVQYCRDWSDDWTNLEAGEAVTLNTGDKIWIRCFTAQNFRMGTFNMDGTFEASGSIMSMLNDEPDSKVIPYEDCFSQLFNGRHGLTKAPALPATTLTKGCYSSMFQSCSNLVSAPVLPATVLAEGCYADMFSGCM